MVDVYAGTAVDVRGVLAGEQTDAHIGTVGHCGPHGIDQECGGYIGGMMFAGSTLANGGPPRCESTSVGGVTMLPARQGPVPTDGAPE
ncbi:hypothetical protein GCM10009610_39820 [Pseudonocardia xinjiangensis]